MASKPGSEFAFHEQRRDSDHESFLAHRRMRWLKVALLVSLLAILGYAFADVQPRPGGGTWYGYTLGTEGRFTNMSALLYTGSVMIFLMGLISEQITALMYKDSE